MGGMPVSSHARVVPQEVYTMVFQLVSVLLDVIAALVAGSCLLRLAMQWQRVPFQQPMGRFVLAISDPIVLPLRRVLPRGHRLDISSLLAAWLVKLMQFVLLWLLAGADASWGTVVLLSLLGLAQLCVSALSAVVLVNAVLSWVQPGSLLYHLSARLCEPFLRPLRQILPLIGGVDLSPLALLLILQLLGIVLANLMHFPLA